MAHRTDKKWGHNDDLDKVVYVQPKGRLLKEEEDEEDEVVIMASKTIESMHAGRRSHKIFQFITVTEPFTIEQEL